MNKLVYISLLSILILYVHCGENDGENDKPADTPATTTTCDGHALADKETCDNLKVSDSTKKKCVEKTEGSKKICKEVDKESAGEMLNIFKISFALLILFTIL